MVFPNYFITEKLTGSVFLLPMKTKNLNVEKKYFTALSSMIK